MNAMKSRALRRRNSWRKAIRKKRISDRYCSPEHPWYDNLHQYADNKIHCSCPLCASKTRGKIARCHGVDANWSLNDLKKIDEMKGQIKENFEE